MHKIAIHGVPRSGTTWLGSIFDSSEYVAYRHQPLFSYELKSFLNEKSSLERVNLFFEKLLYTKDDFILQKNEKYKNKIPTFLKKNISHLVYKEARYHHILNNLLEKESNIKVIGLIRNPKSVLSSWYNAPKEFDKHSWELIKEWKQAELKNQGKPENFYGYCKWKEFSYILLNLKERYNDRVYIVHYKEFLENTVSYVYDIFNFCNIPLTKQTLYFINQSQEKDLSYDVYSVYRANQTDDKWKSVLPKEIIDEIDNDLKNTILEKYLY